MFGLAGVVPLRGQTVSEEAAAGFRRITRHFEDQPFCRVVAHCGPELALAASVPARARDDSFLQQLPDGSVIAFSGKLVNDVASTEDIASFLFSSLRRERESFLPRLNGSFNVFFFDAQQRTFLLASDRLASTPLLYHAGHDYLVFAPDLRGLAGCGMVPTTLDWGAVASVLSSGNPHDGDTYMREVRSLRGGEFLAIAGNGCLETSAYWDYIIEPQEDQGEEHYQKQLHELMIECVDRGLRGAANPVLLLSGGYDSKAILAACLTLGKKVALASYTHRDIRGTDFDCARRVASATGMTFLPLRYGRSELVEGIHQSTVFCSGMRTTVNEYAMGEALEDHGDLLLFGDEAFGWKDGVIQQPRDALKLVHIHAVDDHTPLADVLAAEPFERLRQADHAVLDRLVARTQMPPSHDMKDYFYVTERLARNMLPARLFFRQYAPVWFPWLDAAMLDFTRRLPVRYRIEKNLLRSTAQNMFGRIFQHRNAVINGQISGLKIIRTTCAEHPEEVFLKAGRRSHAIDQIFHQEQIAARARDATRWNFKRELYDRLTSPQGCLSSTAQRYLAFLLRRSGSIARRRPGLLLPNLLERIIRIRYHVGEVLELNLD